MTAFLVRMVTASKWKRTIEDEICSDAITADLRTQNNTLSFWHCLSENERPSKNELKDVVIALAAGRDRLDHLDIICLSEQDILNSQIEIAKIPGETPAIEQIKLLHRDILLINLPKLVKISKLIHLEIIETRQIRFSKKQVSEILKEAAFQGLLQINDLKPKLAQKLR